MIPAFLTDGWLLANKMKNTSVSGLYGVLLYSIYKSHQSLLKQMKKKVEVRLKKLSYIKKISLFLQHKRGNKEINIYLKQQDTKIWASVIGQSIILNIY